MVFVKVRETYDLSTVKNKMTVIGIHTPKPDIIKRNYPGLLMQCRAYRPVSADVRIACASMEPLDPKGVGLAEGDVAPEDMFNPILYKAMSNKGMSQLEARINAINNNGVGLDVDGETAMVEVDSFTNNVDEFPIYYGLLSNTHDWKHASPQAGLSMSGLRPLVYEMVYNVGDDSAPNSPSTFAYPGADGNVNNYPVKSIIGKAKEMPFIACTYYTKATSKEGEKAVTGVADAGFNPPYGPYNAEIEVPYINVICGCIIIPPSRLHELFYRMVVEWTVEFSSIRPLHEITDWTGLTRLGNSSHYQNYSYESTKTALTGDPETILDSDQCMVSANVDINKVM